MTRVLAELAEAGCLYMLPSRRAAAERILRAAILHQDNSLEEKDNR